MSNGWEPSAQAWIDSMGERGDWAREHVLDPVMLGRVGQLVARVEKRNPGEICEHCEGPGLRFAPPGLRR